MKSLLLALCLSSPAMAQVDLTSGVNHFATSEFRRNVEMKLRHRALKPKGEHLTMSTLCTLYPTEALLKSKEPELTALQRHAANMSLDRQLYGRFHAKRFRVKVTVENVNINGTLRVTSNNMGDVFHNKNARIARRRVGRVMSAYWFSTGIPAPAGVDPSKVKIGDTFYVEGVCSPYRFKLEGDDGVTNKFFSITTGTTPRFSGPMVTLTTTSLYYRVTNVY